MDQEGLISVPPQRRANEESPNGKRSQPGFDGADASTDPPAVSPYSQIFFDRFANDELIEQGRFCVLFILVFVIIINVGSGLLFYITYDEVRAMCQKSVVTTMFFALGSNVFCSYLTVLPSIYYSYMRNNQRIINAICLSVSLLLSLCSLIESKHCVLNIALGYFGASFTASGVALGVSSFTKLTKSFVVFNIHSFTPTSFYYRLNARRDGSSAPGSPRRGNEDESSSFLLSTFIPESSPDLRVSTVSNRPQWSDNRTLNKLWSLWSVYWGVILAFVGVLCVVGVGLKHEYGLNLRSCDSPPSFWRNWVLTSGTCLWSVAVTHQLRVAMDFRGLYDSYIGLMAALLLYMMGWVTPVHGNCNHYMLNANAHWILASTTSVILFIVINFSTQYVVEFMKVHASPLQLLRARNRLSHADV